METENITETRYFYKNMKDVEEAETGLRKLGKKWDLFRLEGERHNLHDETTLNLINKAGFHYLILPAEMIDSIDVSKKAEHILPDLLKILNQEIHKFGHVHSDFVLVKAALVVKDIGKVSLALQAERIWSNVIWTTERRSFHPTTLEEMGLPKNFKLRT
jgi:hypothetical protein